jgi:predicted DNA-binding WGR domain protein
MSAPDFKIRLEFVGDNEKNKSGVSRKFWQGEVYGCNFVRRWGAMGTSGQIMRQSFATAEQAKLACLKMVSEKHRKGYTMEVGILTLIGSLA